MEELFFEAFGNLSRDRDIGMGMGPIPFTKMAWYAENLLGMDGDGVRHFCAVLSEMDDAYLKKVADEGKTKDPPKSQSRLRGLRSKK